MKSRLILSFVLAMMILSGCDGQSEDTKITSLDHMTQNRIIGGPFENREFMYIGMPEEISSVDTSPGWRQDGQKLLITGTIFHKDGKTPAPDVILYYYHTDIQGYYSASKNLDQRVRRHGDIRGWVRSDNSGQYEIYTVRPAGYPGNREPAHIHPSIKEPNIDTEYYIDEFVFDDDPLLTGQKRKAKDNRGGSGILRLLKRDNLYVAEHNIILGLNIPDYPVISEPSVTSGRDIGEDVISFTPYHAWGPDKGKSACPICKYGRYHGLLYFVGNHPDWNDITSWLVFLEEESVRRGKFLKAYFIYGNETEFTEEGRISQLAKIGRELNLQHVALTFVPSFQDVASEIVWNNIDSKVDNTIMIFRQSNIVDKYVNLKSGPENFTLIAQRLDETQGAFFDLLPIK